MKRLQFDYRMSIRYDKPIENCHYTIKCFPAENERQKLEKLDVLIEPDNSYGKCLDSFGNRYIYGTVIAPHQTFDFRSQGIITVGLSDKEILTNEGMLGTFRYPYGFTYPGKELRAFYATVPVLSANSNLENAMSLMHFLYARYTYQPNMTTSSTDAEEAWRLGKGVCQDYAHILITLCRLAGIPARYVTGLLIGEGYSHAWVEIFSEGYWYALDPTHDCLVTDDHIKLGVGRDASDCLINRGVLHGDACQYMDIHVSVNMI